MEEVGFGEVDHDAGGVGGLFAHVGLLILLVGGYGMGRLGRKKSSQRGKGIQEDLDIHVSLC